LPDPVTSEETGGHHHSDTHKDTQTNSNEDGVFDLLSETGLYADISDKSINSFVIPFEPKFQLWSDGADKQRWIYIPECDTIDTSDGNNWAFPVGTRMFKEFSVDGMRVETRLITRTGTGPRDFIYTSYLWNDDETDATRVDSAGLQDARGTAHDIPSVEQCLRCHGSYAYGGGRPSRALGFSAIQLHGASDHTTLAELDTMGVFSHPVKITHDVPGDQTTQAALGYLHANCGNCHNSTTDGVPHVDLDLWLDVEATTVEQTAAWTSAVGQPNTLFNDQHVAGRIVPGEPNTSAILYRMSQRGNNAQMPPIATHTVDDNGISIITDWIESLK